MRNSSPVNEAAAAASASASASASAQASAAKPSRSHLSVVRVSSEAANDGGPRRCAKALQAVVVIDGVRWRIAGHKGSGADSVLVLEAVHQRGSQMFITHEAFLRALNGLK